MSLFQQLVRFFKRLYISYLYSVFISKSYLPAKVILIIIIAFLYILNVSPILICILSPIILFIIIFNTQLPYAKYKIGDRSFIDELLKSFYMEYYKAGRLFRNKI